MTKQERRIFELLAEAKSNKEIAFELKLSYGTIKGYLFMLYRKYKLKNRSDAGIWYLKNSQRPLFK